MGYSECVPENDISIVNGLAGVRGDPFGNTARGLAGGLGYVATCGEDLFIVVWKC